MQKLKNDTLQKFLDNFINELKNVIAREVIWQYKQQKKENT